MPKVNVGKKRQYETILDEEDLDLASNLTIIKSGFRGDRPYVSKRTFLHRIILERMLGRPLRPGEQVDHINGDSLDNRRSNLRLVNASQNMQNLKLSRRNVSGFRGVSRRVLRGKDYGWQAYIQVNHRGLYLGTFKAPEEAARAYDQAARRLFGPHARLNFTEKGEHEKNLA